MDETGLSQIATEQQAAIQRGVSECNARFFEADADADKHDGWAGDLKLGLEREIKEALRAATIALTLDDKLGAQKQIKALEAQRNQQRRALFDAQDQVDVQRDQLIAEIEGKVQQSGRSERLFLARWRIK